MWLGKVKIGVGGRMWGIDVEGMLIMAKSPLPPYYLPPNFSLAAAISSES